MLGRNNKNSLDQKILKFRVFSFVLSPRVYLRSDGSLCPVLRQSHLHLLCSLCTEGCFKYRKFHEVIRRRNFRTARLNLNLCIPTKKTHGCENYMFDHQGGHLTF